MGLKVNDPVTVAVKATEVMIGKSRALTFPVTAFYHCAAFARGLQV